MSPQILIVDDEFATRQLLRMYLTREGYTVIEAADGREGVQLAAEHQPDLIIMDVLMPNMDGFTALRHIRTQDTVVSATPVVFLSSRADVDAKEEGLRAGAQLFLVKPFRLHELSETIRALLAVSQGEDRV